MTGLHCRIAIPCLLLIGFGSAAAPQDKPIFRSGTAIVEVTVIVRDRNGAFVPNLTLDDFEVREGDDSRRVETLYVMAASHVAAGGVSSGVDPTTATPTRTAERTFVFLFDMEHISPGSFTRARDAVMQFTRERLGPADLAGVAAIGGTVGGRVSTDRAALAAAVKSLKPSAASTNRSRDLREFPRVTSEAEATEIGKDNNRDTLKRAVDRACEEQPVACETLGGRLVIERDIELKARTFVREARAAAQRSIATLDQLARGLGGLSGRKTAIWISEGTFSDELTEQARQAAYRASQAGVAIYALDPRGLSRRTGGTLEGYAVNEIGTDVLLGAADDSGELLAIGSGGFVIRNENRLDRALRRIEDDTSTYYVLGYAALEGGNRSEYRKLSVRVRRDGLSVRARHGYMAPQRITTAAATASAASPVRLPQLEANAPDSIPPGQPLPIPEPPRMVFTGTIGNTSGAPPAGTLRIRPNAAEVIKELAGGEAASSGDHAAKGWDAYQRGDAENAAVAFSIAAAEAAVRPWVLYALGMSQAALGRPLDAIAAWERVRQAASEFEAVYVDLADAYLQLEQLTKALDVLREAEKRWPRDEEIHNAIGVIHVRRGALDDAIAAFSRAAAVASNEALAYFNLGRAYEMRYARGRRYVTSQRRWVAPVADRDKAIENYQRYLQSGGPYARQATEALSRLEWSKSQIK
jgi:VWFA-related protein